MLAWEDSWQLAHNLLDADDELQVYQRRLNATGDNTDVCGTAQRQLQEQASQRQGRPPRSGQQHQQRGASAPAPAQRSHSRQQQQQQQRQQPAPSAATPGQRTSSRLRARTQASA